MTPRTLTSWPGALTACLLAGALMSGCGDHSRSGALPSPSSSPTTSSATTSSPTLTPTPTPPAGQTVAIGKASLIVPQGWTVDPPDSEQLGFTNPDSDLTCNILQTGGMSEKRATKKLLDELANDVTPDMRPIHRDPNVAAHGALLYHIDAEDKGVMWTDEYGTVSDGYLIGVSCHSTIGLISHHRARTTIAKIMSTFQLR